ncbi:hypothetical protein HZA43_05445 [Candidatus Peregrinibacteria bacterium]|nr:hypothetical protein [Candidatus Peregrinibacteria bacterium]
MKALNRNILVSLFGLILVSQIAFALYAPTYTRDQYSAELFATIGIRYDGTDLHKLNEGAHYFGQTIIGWTKFPSFMSEAIRFAELPEGSTVSAHMQERQNIVFQMDAPVVITPENVQKIEQFINNKLAAYNKVANVHIELENVDSEIVNGHRSYMSGAAIFLTLALVAGGGLWSFFRRA